MTRIHPCHMRCLSPDAADERHWGITHDISFVAGLKGRGAKVHGVVKEYAS
jgi:hypothetical protein